MDADVVKSAVISDDGLYRYELKRIWNPRYSPLTFVMLNPSTADSLVDDPTIRRCIGFAKRDGFGGIRVLNLYGFRATSPKNMFRAVDPVGPQNDEFLGSIPEGSPVVAAWGANAKPDRAKAVMAILDEYDVWCLGFTKAGHPKHPLYLSADEHYLRYGSV